MVARHLGHDMFRLRCSRISLVVIVLAIALSAVVVHHWFTMQRTSTEASENPVVARVPPRTSLPVAIATPAEAEIQVGERLILSAEKSFDPDGEIVQYRWFFAVGNSIEAPNITVQFSTPGLKTVFLTVTDNHGRQASTSASIRVLQPPPQPMLLLSAGPTNVVEMVSGADTVVELRLVAFNQPVTSLYVKIIDDGGLGVGFSQVPESLSPSEETTLRVKIHVPEDSRGPLGATIQIQVLSDQTASNVERIEVAVSPSLASIDLPWELLETTALMAAAFVLYALLRWRGRT